VFTPFININLELSYGIIRFYCYKHTYTPRADGEWKYCE